MLKRSLAHMNRLAGKIAPRHVAKIALAFAVMLGISAPAPCVSAESALERIVDSGVIRIGVCDDLAPMSYLDERGHRQGYDIEIAKRVAADLLGSEARIELVLLAPQDRLTALDDDAADVLFCNFTVTPERSEVVDFATPYLTAHTGVLSSNNDPVTDLSQLRDKKLIVVTGTVADGYFTKNHPEIPLQKYDSDREAFEALMSGAGTAMAQDNHILHAWAARNPGFAVSMPELGEPLLVAPAVKKGDTRMREWLNQEIAGLAFDGFLLKAYELHLAPVFGAGMTPQQAIPGYVEHDK